MKEKRTTSAASGAQASARVWPKRQQGTCSHPGYTARSCLCGRHHRWQLRITCGRSKWRTRGTEFRRQSRGTGGRQMHTDRNAWAIAVDGRAIVEALTKVYGTVPL